MNDLWERVSEQEKLRKSLSQDDITIEQQVELECKMIAQGVERFYKSFNAARDEGAMSRSMAGKALMSSVLDPFIISLEEWINVMSPESDMVVEMDSERLAYLTLSKSIDNIAKRSKLVATAKSIADDIQLELRLQYWLQKDGKVAKSIIKRANRKATDRHKKNGLVYKLNKDGVKEVDWSVEQKVKLGLKLIDRLIVSTGIVKLQLQSLGSGPKTVYLLVPEEGTLEWIDGFNKFRDKSRPRTAPFLIRPKNWEGMFGGGFYNKSQERLTFLKNYPSSL